MPEVSFVISFYNKSFFVPYVLHSVFAQQGLKDCEYVFVDDGSTDDTLEQLKNHSKGQKNVNIIHQKNAGPAIATNRGIEAATGDYIKFVDGDDILHPRSAVELLKAVKETGTDISYSLGESVPTTSEKMNAPDDPLPDVENKVIQCSLDKTIKRALYNLSCVLVSTKLAKEIGGCDPRVFIQDYSIALRIAAHSDLTLVPKVLHWTTMDVDDRASELGGGGQVLHDLNLALAYFLADYPNLTSAQKARIVKRAAGRSWKWAKRVDRASIFSKHFVRYVKACILPNVGDASALTMATCDAFLTSAKIRQPSS